MIKLPQTASDKLNAIVSQADDAQALVSSVVARVANARKQMDAAADPAVFASIEEEIGKLQEKRARHDRRLAELTGVVSQVRKWLSELPTGIVLELARPVRITRGEGGLVRTLGRVRGEIGVARAELERVRRAAPPKAALKEQIHDRVEAMARPPRLTINGDVLKIDFIDPNSMTPPSLARTAALLAWYDPDRMIKLLQAEIDAMPEPALSMTAQDKATRIAELTTSLEKLEREEEAVIEACGAEGIDMTRRPNASPEAILGVTVRQQKKAVAA